MKKILLIILLFLCCFNVVGVNAATFVGAEFLEGISYVKNNGSVVQYRNAQVIRNQEKKYEIAYCVEPFGLMVDNSSYTEDNNYNATYGFDPEKWELAKLYAYYGYGYINHYDSSWISITQMSIWRALFPDYQFDWIDNVNDKNVIYPYENEISELKRLVDTHYLLPNINEEIIAVSGGENTYYDSNEVLQYYRVNSSDLNARIEGNNLIINTDSEEIEGDITLQRAFHNYVEQVKYFYSTSSQNVIQRGDIPFINYNIHVKVKNGKITINKIDSETKQTKPQGEASLDGAIFELYYENGKKIDEKEIVNNYLVFDHLNMGSYYIKEKSSGVGYYLTTNIYNASINGDNLSNSLTVENDVIKSNVRITKYYGTQDDYDNNTMEKEEGVIFKLYNQQEELLDILVTNKYGEVETNLPFGHYILRQETTKEGYSKVNDLYFAINETNSTSFDIVLNDLKIEVPNAGISFLDFVKEIAMEYDYA